MKPIHIFCLVLFLASQACNAGASKPNATLTPGLPVTITIEPPPISVVVPATPLVPPSPTIQAQSAKKPAEQRWAVRSFAEPETIADPDMADGEPDSLECGDTLHAWAPSASSNPAILTLNYAVPLLTEQVNIIQSGFPGGILRVEVLDSASGLGQQIYDGGWPSSGTCPETLSLPIAAGFSVDTVIVTVAASDTPTQIDAVQLVGSLPAFVELPVFWRVLIPSEDPPQESGLPGGMVADSYGNIHVAEGAHGIYTYDVEGNQVHIIPSPAHSNLTDVSKDALGNLIVTDNGYGRFIVLSPSGEQIMAGGEGFADDGPFALAFSPADGNLYFLDETRIRVYASDTAEFLHDLSLDSGAYYGMAFDTAGNLYLAEQYSASVLKVDPSNGEVLDTLGVSALTNTTPRDLALDENGNIYVLVNSSPGDVAVYMLDSHGNLLKRFGKLIYQPPEGERQETDTLFDPISLAVSPDGRFLIICDAVQDRTYLTAFNIKD